MSSIVVDPSQRSRTYTNETNSQVHLHQLSLIPAQQQNAPINKIRPPGIQKIINDKYEQAAQEAIKQYEDTCISKLKEDIEQLIQQRKENKPTRKFVNLFVNTQSERLPSDQQSAFYKRGKEEKSLVDLVVCAHKHIKKPTDIETFIQLGQILKSHPNLATNPLLTHINASIFSCKIIYRSYIHDLNQKKSTLNEQLRRIDNQDILKHLHQIIKQREPEITEEDLLPVISKLTIQERAIYLQGLRQASNTSASTESTCTDNIDELLNDIAQSRQQRKTFPEIKNALNSFIKEHLSITEDILP